MTNLVENILDQSRAGFERIAQGHKLVRWAEESQFAVQALRRNLKLQSCQRETIQDAIINVAACGLTLNPAFGYAYLIPENIKIGDDWVNVCQLRISFKGLIKAAIDSGAIQWVAADVVHKEDTFEFNGKWALPVHNMDPFAEDRGKPTGVYCVARMADGQYITETAPWSEVLKAKAAAKTKKVWEEWEEEMAKKFIIKRASKQWPKFDRVERTVSIMNEYEGSEQIIDQMDETAAYIVEHIAEGDTESVLEAYNELTDEEKGIFFTAKTKGGWLTMDEKKFIREANHAVYVAANPEEAAKALDYDPVTSRQLDAEIIEAEKAAPTNTQEAG